MKSKYRILSVLAILALCLIVFIFHTISSNRIQKLYSESTHDSIYKLKESFLKDTVNNQIARISNLVEVETEAAERQVKELEMQVEALRADNSPLALYEAFFNNEQIADTFTVVIWDASSNKTLYDPKGLLKEEESGVSITSIPDVFAAHRSIIEYSGPSCTTGMRTKSWT